MTSKKAFVLSLVVGLSFVAHAEEPIAMFSRENIDKAIRIDLFSNFEQVIRDTRHEFPDRRTPQMAILRHTFSDKVVDARALIRARGWDRLNQCEIPPMKLDFDKKVPTTGTAFEGTKDLKLVNSCYTQRGKKAVWRAWAKREYIVYKMYEHISSYSYKVRPIYVNYRHNDGRLVWDGQDFGFLIENTSQMAKRNGGKKYDLPENVGMNWRNVEYWTYLKLSLFQYMINNTDYGVLPNDMRNIDVVRDDKTGTLYPVPFDFDQAEFVRLAAGKLEQNTKLMESDSNLICFKWSAVQQMLPHFKAAYPRFMNEINRHAAANYMNPTAAQLLRNGVDNFFRMMDNGELKKVVDRTWDKNDCR